MHVLIVAYHFPPDRAVGALRPARIAEALRAAGHRVSIITAKLPGEVQPIRPAAAGMAVFAVDPVPNPRELYLRGKRLIGRIGRSRGSTTSATGRHADAESPEPEVARTVPLWKRSISSVLWLPDDRQGFVPAAVAAARGIHAEHAIDWLITTAPPFSAHLAGLRIQRGTGARWVADFRDPWTDNPWKPAAVRTSLTDRIEAWLEQRVLQRADLVLSASEGIQRFFERRRGADLGKLLVIRNGIEAIMERPARNPADPFRILHMGTFYQGRNPRPFLEALAGIRHRTPTRPVRADFVGRSRHFKGQSIPDMAHDLQLDDVVVFHDFMPREEVVRMAAESDLLLLLAQGQPDQVPQKLYEYLGTRVPILAFADAEGESARMLARAGGHFVVFGDDAAGAEAALEQALTTLDGTPAGDHAVLTEWTTDGQLRRLMAALGG